MYIKLDREYEVKTTLGTIRDIERMFDKSFFEILESVAAMKIDDQIKLLYVGIKKANPEMTEKVFDDLCNEHIGLETLIEHLEKYLFSLQFPGLSEEEVEEKLAKKSKSPDTAQKGKSSRQ